METLYKAGRWVTGSVWVVGCYSTKNVDAFCSGEMDGCVFLSREERD